ncbi:hypothetical protein BH23BAC1_BH23BAC1_28720 [soil metagenome]
MIMKRKYFDFNFEEQILLSSISSHHLDENQEV